MSLFVVQALISSHINLAKCATGDVDEGCYAERGGVEVGNSYKRQTLSCVINDSTSTVSTPNVLSFFMNFEIEEFPGKELRCQPRKFWKARFDSKPQHRLPRRGGMFTLRSLKVKGARFYLILDKLDHGISESPEKEFTLLYTPLTYGPEFRLLLKSEGDKINTSRSSAEASLSLYKHHESFPCLYVLTRSEVQTSRNTWFEILVKWFLRQYELPGVEQFVIDDFLRRINCVKSHCLLLLLFCFVSTSRPFNNENTLGCINYETRCGAELLLPRYLVKDKGKECLILPGEVNAKRESRYSTRSMVLIKGATVTDMIRTCPVSKSDPKSNVLDRWAIYHTIQNELKQYSI
ncbi:hypothetical protein J6590_042958 [Homalodisca vitripennis]|nr:hypothetical protein J6590_042958 [Homalodisca vitripennis]